MKHWRYPALAFLTGAAVTIFEFAAPNLFRAYFGQTIHVWANVIGVILAALAIGYAAGGRLADGTRSLRPLAAVLAFAGGYALLVGIFGPDICLWLAGPEEYSQDTALRAFLVQSLAASIVLFGPPLVALGMATPLLVERASGDWPVGRAAGLVFAVGTFGSLTGIYATTFLFVDWFGVRATISLAAGMLLLLSAGLFWAGGGRRPAAATLLLLGGVPFGTAAPWEALPPQGGQLVLALESPYQLIRVVDRPPDESGAERRWLAFDEGMGTYHSMRVDSETRWTDAYYDVFMMVPPWVGGAAPTRICILGNAAGTMSQLLHLHYEHSRLEIDAVEIDPQVTEASRRTMGFDPAAQPKLRLYHADGRTFLRGRPERSYDAILLDAYARQVSIPPALATREFFEMARDRLTDRGILFVNLGALRPGGTLVHALADTMAAAFGTPVYRCPLQHQANVLLIAARAGPPPPPPPGTRLLAPASFGLHVAGDRVLTDDFCPVESLTADDLRLR